MRGALKRVAATGDMQAYFAIQQEYDAIEETSRTRGIKQAELFKELALKSIEDYSSARRKFQLIEESVDPEVLAELAEKVNMETGDTYRNTSLKHAFINNPNTPEETISTILSSMTESSLSSAFPQGRLNENAKNAIMRDPNSSDRIRARLISNEGVSDEEALELASKTNGGYTRYAIARNVWTPEIEEKVYQETKDEKKAYYRDRDAEFYLKNATNKAQLLDVVSTTDLPDDALENPNIDTAIASKVLERTKGNWRYSEIREAVISHPSLPSSFKASLAAVKTGPIYSGKAPSELIAEAGEYKTAISHFNKYGTASNLVDAKWVKDTDHSGSVNHKYNTTMAKIDSYESNYAKLNKTYENAIADGKSAKTLKIYKDRLDQAHVLQLGEQDKAILGA